jgi:serine protease SohB
LFLLHYFIEYGLFLAKVTTLVVAIIILMSTVVALATRSRRQDDQGHLEIRHLNQEYDDLRADVAERLLPESSRKKAHKQRQKEDKRKQKAEKKAGHSLLNGKPRERVFVIDFNGDINASSVENMRREISALLNVSNKEDEVLVRLESPGGVVHGYGLAASQLERIRKRGLRLTVCVDKVAASGGYMMACIGDRILAAPFAILGSIGVVAQIPNFHRLLKKHDVDVELMTAGEYKRTLTMFGENTDHGREKFQEELEDAHSLFKSFVREHRRSLDLAKVATGEHWFGVHAKELGLVDDILTSDEYLEQRSQEADLYQFSWHTKKRLSERLGLAAEGAAVRLVGRLWQRGERNPLL